MSELNEGIPGEVKFSLWDQDVLARQMYREATGNGNYEVISDSARAYWREVARKELLNTQNLSKPETAVNPSHYDFPGGVQVKDISAHLTSFGGQALQYIARSTRLDGMNKGEQVTDLQKAIKLIEWEIERVKEQCNE